MFVHHFNRRPIDHEMASSVMSFFFLFAATYAVLALLLGALGPVIGPSGTFAPLPDAAKWVLSAGMLLGRLELFTVLVLLTPSFWRG